MLAAGENQDLGMLYDMHHLAPFSDTFAPSGTDMVTHCLDQPIAPDSQMNCFVAAPHAPTLLHNNMRVDDDVGSKGGAVPHLIAVLFAANTTKPPAEFLMQQEAQRADMHEKYNGPSDV